MKQSQSLDMSELLLDAYQLADQINESPEVKNYLEAKKKLMEDPEAQSFIQQFQKVKDQFEEAQRFGIFHPNYHEAKEKAKEYQAKMKDHPVIGPFLKAEEVLDDLLYQVSSTIAKSVSESIKIPMNEGRAGERRVRKTACGG